MLELRRLRLLRELHERGTIAAVADALQFTPSAVSQQPALEALRRAAPRLRCELLELEPEEALPMLALGDIDLVLGDEWQHQPRRLPPGVERHELMEDRVRILLPARHPAARRHPDAVPLSELANDPWTTGHAGLGWDEMTRRTCRELGGFDPDVRHRTNDAGISLEVISQGLAVGML